MASVLDLGLIEGFDLIFVFLLIIVLVFALLEKFAVLGKDKTGLNWLISIAIGFLSLISPKVIDLVKFIAPWFVLLFLFLVLLMLTFQILGAKDTDFSRVLNKDTAIGWTIVGIGIVIIVAGIGVTFGQDLLEQRSTMMDDSGNPIVTDASDFETNILQTMFHPKMLGVMALFGISIFAVALLSGKM